MLLEDQLGVAVALRVIARAGAGGRQLLYREHRQLLHGPRCVLQQVQEAAQPTRADESASLARRRKVEQTLSGGANGAAVARAECSAAHQRAQPAGFAQHCAEFLMRCELGESA